jgi:hypothetical protein
VLTVHVLPCYTGELDKVRYHFYINAAEGDLANVTLSTPRFTCALASDIQTWFTADVCASWHLSVLQVASTSTSNRSKGG